MGVGFTHTTCREQHSHEQFFQCERTPHTHSFIHKVENKNERCFPNAEMHAHSTLRSVGRRDQDNPKNT